MRVWLSCALVLGCVSPRDEPVLDTTPDAAPSEPAPAIMNQTDTGAATSLDAPMLAGDGSPGQAGSGWTARDAASSMTRDSAADTAVAVPCRADELSCNGSTLCDPGAWDFDHGVPPGWRSDAAVGRRVRSGSGSMSVKIVDASFWIEAATQYTFCGRGNSQTMFPGVDVRGRTFVGWVNLEVTAGTFVSATCTLGGGGGGAVIRGPDIPVSPDQWTEIRYQFGANDINASNAWSISIWCSFPEASPIEGWVHLDDVAIR